MSSTLWNNVLNILEKKLTTYQFNTWLKETKQISRSDKKIVIGVPSKLHQNHIESKLLKDIKSLLQEFAQNELQIQFKTLPDLLTDDKNSTEKLQKVSVPKNQNPGSPFNSNYTFGNFVIGDGNRLAHAACLAVAKNPSRAYNPLFIYGGVGLGKTHLLQSIGNFVFKKQPHLKLIYTTTEEFANQFVDSILRNRLPSFRIKYRSNDILLIDDIQFIADKEGIQENFFHTFNTLYESGKQVVITSDRPPKEIATLEARLRSRFESGFLTDIKIPNLETREAILRKIIKEEKVDIPDEIIHFLATKIKYNIRDLKGALNTLIGTSSLSGDEINLKSTRKILKDFYKDTTSKDVTMTDILEKVSLTFKLNVKDLKTRTRTNTISFPRQICMYIAREITDLSTTEIGKEFGKDHTTTLYSHKKIQGLRKKDSLLDERLDIIINELRERI